MTLTSHAVIGLALASFIPAGPYQLPLAFVLSLGGHYLTDAIPHWDYTPPLLQRDQTNALNHQLIRGKKFWLGLGWVAGDGLVGLILGLVIFHLGLGFSLGFCASSMFGSVLPDFWQFCYLHFRRQPWLGLQKFHHLWHHSWQPKKPWWGMLVQGFFLTIVLILVWLTH